MNSAHRILICGLGSVGERHLNNLACLGYTELAAFRTSKGALRTTIGSNVPRLSTYLDLREALNDFRPTIAIISNPTALHLTTAITCARAGCHIFIEKPMGDNLDGTEELISILRERRSYGMVGYMLRHHPHFKTVKKWLEQCDDGPLGRPIWLRSSWGEYLPDWHPWEDYRRSYAARPDLGGGPALTLSHDLDLALWMLGTPTMQVAISNSASELEIACNHGIDILMSFKSGASANLHLDYFQSPAQRTWELVGTKATAIVDYIAGSLTYRPNAHSGKGGETISQLPTEWTRNSMFLSELKYFVDSIDAGQQPSPDIQDGAKVVRTALAAQNFRRGALD